MEVIKLGLGGFGTVGSGLAKILDMNADRIAKRLDRKIEIKSALVRDLNKKRAFDLGPNATLTDNPDELVNDPEVDIIVELMGGLDTARDLILKAFAAGKHVVTANKHLLAEHGLELFQAARENNVASCSRPVVPGAFPLFRHLRKVSQATKSTTCSAS